MVRHEFVVGSVVAGVVSVLAACGGQIADENATEPAPESTAGAALTRSSLPNNFPILNTSGFAATFSTVGAIDLSGPFFQSFGTNGRSCGSCHIAAEGWTITPAGVRRRFEQTGGTDPIFRTVDGSSSPLADVSTVAARRRAYVMLLTKGLIRIHNAMPVGADFTLESVDDPYGYANASDISTFRRPLPTANLGAISTVMWDGRETQTTTDPSDPNLAGCSLPPTAPKCWRTVDTDLHQQSNDATLTHAEATLGLLPAQQDEIVRFQQTLFFGQIYDFGAEWLNARGAQGGPTAIASRTFYFGENDVLSGDYRTRAPFTTKVFDEYDAWASANRESGEDQREHGESHVEKTRRSVARGQEIFNSKPIAIVGVKGINDDFGVPVFNGNCTTCHDTPHGGNHSIPAPLDIGLTGDHPEALARTPDLPSYTFRRTSDGATFTTTDPGRGLITGKFKDLGRFKGPVLRGLAARAPYFHNGSAATVEDAVNFYDKRFAIGLTDDEKQDLAAFLKTL